MQLVGDLPLSVLGGLLSYAEEQELKPLMIANQLLRGINGGASNDALFDFEPPSFSKSRRVNRTPEDIEADFLSIVNADKQSGKES